MSSISPSVYVVIEKSTYLSMMQRLSTPTAAAAATANAATPDAIDDQPLQEDCHEVEELLAFLAPQRRAAARQCLACLARTGLVQFCPRDWCLCVRGSKMVGSNIVDLLSWLLRPACHQSDERQAPVAWREFLDAVASSSMPVTLCPHQRQRDQLCIARKKQQQPHQSL